MTNTPDLRALVERLLNEFRFMSAAGGASQHARGVRYAAQKLLKPTEEVLTTLQHQLAEMEAARDRHFGEGMEHAARIAEIHEARGEIAEAIRKARSTLKDMGES